MTITTPRKTAAPRTPKKSVAATPAPEPTEPIGIVAESVRLANAINALKPFTDKDGRIMNLACIHIEAQGKTIVLAACDRYVLGEYTFAYEGDPFVADLHQSNVQMLVTFLRAAPIMAATYLRREKERLVVTLGKDTLSVPLEEDPGFPKWRGLFPDASELDGRPALCDPDKLVKFTKVRLNKDDGPLSLRIAKDKPIIITVEDYFRGLIMPMRSAPKGR